MNTKSITLRSPLNSKKLRVNINNLLNRIQDIQYISIYTRFKYTGHSFPYLSLGNKCYLDLNKKEDKSLYLDYLVRKYELTYLNKASNNKITSIVIYTKEIDKCNYNQNI